MFSDETRHRILSSVQDALNQTATYLIATAASDRTDRLWPGEQELYTTNPMSLAYGACGPALLLHELNRLPAEVEGWLLNRRLSFEDYPPGLSVGLGGIAYALGRLGYEDRADEAMLELYRSPLKFEAPNIMLGAAGWGVCSLHRFTVTGNRDHLVWAMRAAEFVVDCALETVDGLYWPVQSEERIHYGFGYGSSGIALFMLYLHVLTGDAEALNVAQRALDFDLAHEETNEWGPTWRRWEQDQTIRPYWIHGAAGIGAVVIRFYLALGAPRHLAIAERIAESLFIKFTVTPGQFEGMAGIAEFMLDMYAATGEQQYRERAVDLADTMLWFGVRRSRGLAWPGVSLEKVSSDFSCGAAGIGLFFRRMLNAGARTMFDLDHYLPIRRTDIAAMPHCW